MKLIGAYVYIENEDDVKKMRQHSNIKVKTIPCYCEFKPSIKSWIYIDDRFVKLKFQEEIENLNNEIELLYNENEIDDIEIESLASDLADYERELKILKTA